MADIIVTMRWTGHDQNCEAAIAQKNRNGTVSALPSLTQLSVSAACYPDATILLDQKLSDYIDELTRFRDEVLRTKLVYKKTIETSSLPK